ncbi:MAG: STAS domain-containing protein [Candidatus Endonucleobacter bathymodioli]|uniref:STAS domain-containing protein n=1 Tax=Candidatus Endonucleibacter bathymodioli TaxID=539814 RepID=A0AA90SXG1_9GAMM|nr:STAS domain-containing protein [Candidatus Endonucleobacter bathymodioli]
MSLELTEELGCFKLVGPVTFDNAAKVAANGEKVLSKSLVGGTIGCFEINLIEVKLSDSSALSVLLSWMRFANKKNITICFSHIPRQIQALAKVSDLYDLIQATSCAITSK